MATNPYFNKRIPHPDSDVYERLQIESIKIKGDDYFYIPRSLNKVDQIYGEDVLSSFDVAVPLEMYLEDVTGYGGESEILSKFGMEIRDTASFIFSRKRYTEAVVPLLPESRNSKVTFRPNEGDLIYVPVSRSLFEIKFVEDELPSFYQLKKKFVWLVKCELFQLNSEKFATGIEELDIFSNTSNRLGFGILPEVGTGHILTESGGWILQEEYVVSDAEKYSDLNGFGDNEKLKKEFKDILFDSDNPFGDLV